MDNISTKVFAPGNDAVTRTAEPKKLTFVIHSMEEEKIEEEKFNKQIHSSLTFLPLDVCKIIVNYFTPPGSYVEMFFDERFNLATNNFLFRTNISDLPMDFVREQFCKKIVDDLVGSIKIIHSGKIQDFFEMIDLLWKHSTSPVITMAEKKFHLEFSKFLKNILGGWMPSGYRGDWSVTGIAIVAPLGRAWKDTNPARIFAEWWYCYGHRCAEVEWFNMIEIFGQNFRSLPATELCSVVKILALVFWAACQPNSGEQGWYNQFAGSRTFGHSGIPLVFSALGCS